MDLYQALKCKTLFDLSLPEGRCVRLDGWSGPASGESCPPSRVGEADDRWLRVSGGAAWLFAAGDDAHAPWSSSEAVLVETKKPRIIEKKELQLRTVMFCVIAQAVLWETPAWNLTQRSKLL